MRILLVILPYLLLSVHSDHRLSYLENENVQRICGQGSYSVKFYTPNPCSGSIISKYHFLTASGCFLYGEEDKEGYCDGNDFIIDKSFHIDELFITAHYFMKPSVKVTILNGCTNGVSTLNVTLRNTLALVQLDQEQFVFDDSLNPICLGEVPNETWRKNKLMSTNYYDYQESYYPQEVHLDNLRFDELLEDENVTKIKFQKNNKVLDDLPTGSGVYARLYGKNRAMLVLLGVFEGEIENGAPVAKSIDKFRYNICSQAGVCA